MISNNPNILKREGEKLNSCSMDAESSKPRINGAMLSSSIGQYVCVVGKNLGVSEVCSTLIGRFCVVLKTLYGPQISSDGLSVSVEMSDGHKLGARFPQPFVRKYIPVLVNDTVDLYLLV